MTAPLYLLSATLFFTALNICVKYLPHIPASELVFFRGLITLIICYVALKKMKISVWGQQKKLLILRGFFGTLSLLALFYGLQRMPIAMAMTLSNLAPLFTVMLAHFLLRERSHWLHGVCLFGAFGGVLLVKGADLNVPWSLALIGVGGAFSAACAYTCIRVLRHSDHVMVILFYFPLLSVPITFFPMIKNWVTPSLQDWLLIGIIGILTQWAQYFMTKAYQLEKAAKIMIYNYAAILWALLVGFFIFHETLSLWQWIGFASILSSLIFSARLSRQEAAEEELRARAV
jgi:drug/metabolite transporter (DMT)-like permease